MDDKEREESQVDAASAGQIQVEFRPDGLGDGKGQMYMDGEPVGREVIPQQLVPQAGPAADPDEAAAIRRERDELRQQFDAAEPFLRIAHDPLMREILQEKIERGEIEPPRPTPPTSRDVLEYNVLREDPDFETVRGIMEQWATTLLPHEAEALNRNHGVFVREYQRIKAEAGGRLPKARPPAPSRSHLPDNLREALERTETRRNSTFVEPPGPAPTDYPDRDEGRDAGKSYAAAKSRLIRAREGGTPTDISKLETDLIQAFFGDEPKTPRRSRGPEY